MLLEATDPYNSHHRLFLILCYIEWRSLNLSLFVKKGLEPLL